MQLSGLDLFLWAASFIGTIVLLLVVWTRHRAEEFPVFTSFISCNAVTTIALYFVQRHSSKWAYFYSYWALGAVNDTLQVFVFYELASQVFCPLGTWAKDVKKAFIYLICASTLVALLLTLLAAPPAKHLMQRVVIQGDFFSYALMSELFVGTMILSSTAGLPWKTHVAKISQGMGVCSVVSLVSQAGTNYFGVKDLRIYAALSQFRIGTYLLCLGFWIVSLWQEAPEPKALPEQMLSQIFILQKRMESDLGRLKLWRSNERT